jgi:hypothetical protein
MLKFKLMPKITFNNDIKYARKITKWILYLDNKWNKINMKQNAQDYGVSLYL